MASVKELDNSDSLFLAKNECSLKFAKDFISTLMDVMLCNDVIELKDHIIPDCAWKEVQKRMNITINTLKHVWYRRMHIQLFSPVPIYLNDIKIKLIEFLYATGVSDKRNIKWDRITMCMEGTTAPFLYGIFNNLINLAISKTGSHDLSDLIAYLHKEHIPYIIKHPEDRKLPRLKFVGDELTHVDTDLSKDESC